MADIADMADRANSKVIFPTIAYIDGKSEIISDSLTHWLTDSTNCKEMLSHLKIVYDVFFQKINLDFIRKQVCLKKVVWVQAKAESFTRFVPLHQ